MQSFGQMRKIITNSKLQCANSKEIRLQVAIELADDLFTKKLQIWRSIRHQHHDFVARNFRKKTGGDRGIRTIPIAPIIIYPTEELAAQILTDKLVDN
jgi:hypothetical protein